ncbi:hypothetical protein MMC13_003173 [Lambiella insularis]|nr:hypothetical protein [Lambiella insularis]
MSTDPAIAADLPGPSHGALGPNTYTAQRLEHAGPEHLHITARRCFIGPIPEDWLSRKSHRRAWYRHSLNFSRYSSRTATFAAGDNVSHQKSTTGIDVPRKSATQGQSFPQPDDVDEDYDRDADHVNRTDQASTRNANHLREMDAGTNAESTEETTSRSPGNGARILPSVTSSENPTVPTDGALRNVLSTVAESSTLEPPEFGVSAGSSLAALDTLDGDSTSSLLPIAPFPVKSSKRSQERPRQDQGRRQDPPEGYTGSVAEIPELRDVEPEGFLEDSATELAAMKKAKPNSSGLVRFNLPDEVAEQEQWAKTKVSNVLDRASVSQLRKPKSRPGVLIKTEKMLVRVDYTRGDLPADYDENSSLAAETRTIEKWREFVVVCRKSTDEAAEFVIQIYKTRVIPGVEQANERTRYTYAVPLARKTTKLNMYSSLDKTIVLWAPWKSGTRIYILRPRSTASSVEWYTLFNGALGHSRSASLKVKVPDLNMTLQIANPFEDQQISRDAMQIAKKDFHAMTDLIDKEETIASTIVERSMHLLRKSPEWSDAIETWLRREKVGLAWKRYDRLEWVHGANEQRMYGTAAMEKTHDLELRPKEHYPTTAVSDDKTALEEPPAVEGFLVRLTSQKGRERKFGKMFSTKSYFSTHNQYLCFCKPAKALVPIPPELPTFQGDNIPTRNELKDKIPLIYGVNPYPVKDGKITWLLRKTTIGVEEYDQRAFEETQRKINLLIESEGYINLCSVNDVREVQGALSPTPNQDEQTSSPKTAQEAEDGRTFELVIKNGLVVRLKAYNEATKSEWMERIAQISQYWKFRTTGDMELHKIIRKTNLDELGIDEEMESFVGQYAKKWEVTRSMSGSLYRKPRMHSTFKRCSVMLCHGRMLIYEETLRAHTGKEIPHILHRRQDVLDLKDTYIYSGGITEGDLLYQNQTFDSNHPGHHALPRVYLKDNWTSSDEDTTTCFVIWQGQKKSLFMSRAKLGEGKTKSRLRYVSRLGVPGRSIVFKARSRAERDQWVIQIGMEIERLQQAEEIRVVAKT